jgi:hypothetical protein
MIFQVRIIPMCDSKYSVDAINGVVFSFYEFISLPSKKKNDEENKVTLNKRLEH